MKICFKQFNFWFWACVFVIAHNMMAQTLLPKKCPISSPNTFFSKQALEINQLCQFFTSFMLFLSNFWKRFSTELKTYIFTYLENFKIKEIRFLNEKNWTERSGNIRITNVSFNFCTIVIVHSNIYVNWNQMFYESSSFRGSWGSGKSNRLCRCGINVWILLKSPLLGSENVRLP